MCRLPRFPRPRAGLLVVCVGALATIAQALEPPQAVRATAVAATQAVTFTEDTSDFPNPERGFYRQFAPFWKGTDRAPLDATQLAAYRSEGISLFRGYYVIDEFRETELSSSMLAALNADFAAVRQAGIKIIPRFTYNYPLSDAEMFAAIDAPLPRVLQHIEQLAPVFQANADVIAFVEVGFVGAWGEWHHSSNQLLNDDHSVNTSSAAVMTQLLSAVPARRAIALRYPYHKQALYGASPLTSEEAFSGSPRARVGAHNDCFLANDIDGGTYAVPPNYAPMIEPLKQYLSQDNRFLPQGGESCTDDMFAQPYIGCANALIDLARMHWHTMNIEWHPAVIQRWKNEGCFDTVRKRLGYRLRLTSALLPTQVRQGRSMGIQVSLVNDGFGAPYNARAVELILRSEATGATSAFPLSADPRFWDGGTAPTLTATVAVPAAFPPGVYQMLLNFPDPEPTLRLRPQYSVRLANTGTWEPSTGFNKLLAAVTVTTPAPFTDPVLLSGITPVRGLHITELRSRVDALRVHYNLPPFAWTGSSLIGAFVRAAHITELRDALGPVYTAAGATAPVYADPTLTAGATPIKAIHITELRTAVVALE